jgi:hypothetical protein
MDARHIRPNPHKTADALAHVCRFWAFRGSLSPCLLMLLYLSEEDRAMGCCRRKDMPGLAASGGFHRRETYVGRDGF